MPTKMYILGEAGLWRRPGALATRLDLERDLNNFLQGRGEVIWDGDEHRGSQWNVDLLLHEEAEDVSGWVRRLTAFLRQWGIPDHTLSFTIIREGDPPRWERRRVEVAGG
jgi:hypothetical protein